MPIYGPLHLEYQTSQLGTIALLAEWLELPDFHALELAPGSCGGLEWSRGESGKLKRRHGWPSECRMFGPVKGEQSTPGRTVKLMKTCPD